MILISACLCGVDCKYSGKNNYNERVYELFKSEGAIPVCPEQLGGLPTPRHPAEITGGTAEDVLKRKARVMNNQGEEVTTQFIKGAEETLKIAKAAGCTKAILKAKSPSCGHGKIYNGSFNGTLIEGKGVTVQLLLNNGIEVITEEDIL